MAPPTTTPPSPGPAPWDGAIQWLTDAAQQVAHWVTWTFTVQHLAEAAVVVALVAALRAWHVFRLLRARRAWAIIPSERYIRRLTDDLVTTAGRGFGQVRRQALILSWWLRPASAIRFRLDSVNFGGTIYSISGPPWAREVIEVAGYRGIIHCPMDALDLSRLTPKGLYVAPEEPFGFDAQTQPDGLLTPAGR